LNRKQCSFNLTIYAYVRSYLQPYNSAILSHVHTWIMSYKHTYVYTHICIYTYIYLMLHNTCIIHMHPCTCMIASLAYTFHLHFCYNICTYHYTYVYNMYEVQSKYNYIKIWEQNNIYVIILKCIFSNMDFTWDVHMCSYYGIHHFCTICHKNDFINV